MNGKNREVSYGSKGSSNGKCPRCERGSDSHHVSRCDISDATVKGVESLLAAAKAMDKGEAADHMIGALIAMTSTGQEIKLVAVSGPQGFSGSVHGGWEVANIAVPRGAAGWTDIYGRTFELPAGVNPGNACAAIKLLSYLGMKRRSAKTPYDYNSIHLYEQACRAKSTKEDKRGRSKSTKSTRLQNWIGQGVEYTFAAHSCPDCEMRVPLMLCDRPVD